MQKFAILFLSTSTCRYLDDLLNIDNIQFEHMVHRIYPAERQLNKVNASDTKAAFLDLNLSIHDKRLAIYGLQENVMQKYHILNMYLILTL